jgi:hypothetical protein
VFTFGVGLLLQSADGSHWTRAKPGAGRWGLSTDPAPAFANPEPHLTRADTAATERTLRGPVPRRSRPGAAQSPALPQGGPGGRPHGSGPTQLGQPLCCLLIFTLIRTECHLAESIRAGQQSARLRPSASAAVRSTAAASRPAPAAGGPPSLGATAARQVAGGPADQETGPARRSPVTQLNGTVTTISSTAVRTWAVPVAQRNGDPDSFPMLSSTGGRVGASRDGRTGRRV